MKARRPLMSNHVVVAQFTIWTAGGSQSQHRSNGEQPLHHLG
jgi:hypothetical protein